MTNNHMDELPQNIKYAIYNCRLCFIETKYILDHIKNNMKVKNKMKIMTTIWENPYM